MADPSTVPASAAGTEILRRATQNIASNSSTVKLLDGVANHTYTILSIIFFNTSASDAEDVLMWLDGDGAGSTERSIIDETIPAQSTFVWNDKFIMVGTDELVARLDTGSGNVNTIISYIEQRWAQELA